MAKPKIPGEGSGQIDRTVPKLDEIDQERISRVFISEEERKFFNQIDSHTFGREAATHDKKLLVLEIREKNLLDQKVLREYPSVYFGCATDIELPICLGAKDILMVDPFLANPAGATEIEQKILQVVSPEAVSRSDKTISFKTKGDELETKITIIPEWYGSEEYFVTQDKMAADLNEKLYGKKETPAPKNERKIFQPPEKTGLVLGYLRVGMDFDISKLTTDSLIQGGYVIQDGRPRSLLANLSEDRREEISGSEHPEIYYREEWKRRGYEYIDLPDAKQGLTFLKKM